MDLHRYDDYPRARGPFALWRLAALVGIVVGAATITGAFTTDTGKLAGSYPTAARLTAL
jgi:hypothetical protein